MGTFKARFPERFFVLKCAVVGGSFMLGCMAAGEILIRADLFGAFLLRPKVWPMVFLETAVWAIPCVTLSLPILRRMRHLSQRHLIYTVTGVWVALSALFVVLQCIAYSLGPWTMADLLRADMVFGWTIPLVLTVLAYISFSLGYLRELNNKSPKRKYFGELANE